MRRRQGVHDLRGFCVEEERPYRPLLSYTKDDLAALFGELGLPSYRVGQTLRWIYSRKTARFSQMTDISKETRSALTRLFSRPPVHEDGFRPLLIQDGSQTPVEPDDFDAADSVLEGRLVARSVSSDGSGATVVASSVRSCVTTVIIAPHV